MDKSALQRFFLNECSNEERQDVIDWLLDPQNNMLVKSWMKQNWDLVPIMDREIKSGQPDVQQIWSNLREELFDAGAMDEYEVEEKEAPLKKMQPRIRKTWWVAAAASVIIALGVYAYAYQESILYVRYQTDFGEVSEFKLPDGSMVVLNANSSLLVPRWGFNQGDRKVELKGEAAFDVTHTANHRKFLVTTNSQLDVEVLGTEFLVYSRNQTNRVTLKKGSVKVRFTNDQLEPVMMKPGDVVITDKAGSLSVKHRQPVSNSIPWKDHRFVFESTALTEVISNISEFFGDDISISDKAIGKKTITGSFRAKSSVELLTIISEMYNLEIEQTKKQIILREKTLILNEQ